MEKERSHMPKNIERTVCMWLLDAGETNTAIEFAVHIDLFRIQHPEIFEQAESIVLNGSEDKKQTLIDILKAFPFDGNTLFEKL